MWIWDGSKYVERPDRPGNSRKYRPEPVYQPGQASREASRKYATVLYVVLMLVGAGALVVIVW